MFFAEKRNDYFYVRKGKRTLKYVRAKYIAIFFLIVISQTEITFLDLSLFSVQYCWFHQLDWHDYVNRVKQLI